MLKRYIFAFIISPWIYTTTLSVTPQNIIVAHQADQLSSVLVDAMHPVKTLVGGLCYVMFKTTQRTVTFARKHPTPFLGTIITGYIGWRMYGWLTAATPHQVRNNQNRSKKQVTNVYNH